VGGLLATFFGEFWVAAWPIIVIAAAATTALFCICFALYRWRRVSSIAHSVYRVILRRQQYDYHRIFTSYVDRVSMVNNRRDLYQAILEHTVRTIRADGASLLVADGDGSFSVKATCGIKPFSCDVSDVRPFIEWMTTRRALASRRFLLTSKKCKDVKIEGLRCCVQFNSEACVPIHVGDQLVAILNLGARIGGTYDRETRTLLNVLSLQYATSIHNADLTQQVDRQNATIKQTQAFKDQLLANLSHELRTPLNSIIGLSEMMAEGADGAVNAEQVTHLSMIRQSGQRLLDSVSAVLDLSKIEANRLELDVRRLKLSRLVTEAATNLNLSKGTKLVVDLKDELPGVYGDEKRLRQVIHQLLDNAAKFTRAGKITVEAAKTGEMLKVCVRDTGIGIRKEARKNIFEGFVQADGTHTREGEGLGLGLSISRKIVELHGGRMWFNSQLGRGSEFFFTLPLKPTTVRHNEI
jgi:signal transduction histidine kinase